MTAGPPPEWKRIADEQEVPVWQHLSEPVRVTTWDLTLLRHLDVALARFSDMGPDGAYLPPPPGTSCCWTDVRNST
ncbi:hypothetical protein [Actinomadura sp. DC4]|uniref:hypothetical protein n=1 Tax=Actinomadura sp. DC4 TaxID=3055069 RepID=UPI0025B0E06C|nr:hypothetical protein [Actinomadura sp. DC4]MDN3353587.1 hypothetical protein [Actinomadura sp. DC4]